jgi:hypothetical protein
MVAQMSRPGFLDVRVPPGLSHWPRWNRIIGNGSWDIPQDGAGQAF